MVVFPITPTFAAEVGDVDLAAVDDAQLKEIEQAFWKHSVLVFPDQQLSVDQHLAFAKRLGPLETSMAQYRPGAELRVPAKISDVSNLECGDKIWEKDSQRRLHERGNLLWHTDSSFRRIPAYASLLYARAIPPVGGLTEFADLRAAYNALPEDMQIKLQDLIAEHCILYSRSRIGFTDFSQREREAMPPAPQPLVRTIPQTGRRTLYLASHAGRIRGLPNDEAKALIDQLIKHSTQRGFVYMHRWRINDLVMWDNRCTMHRGKEFDDLRWKRDVQRATVSETAPICE